MPSKIIAPAAPGSVSAPLDGFSPIGAINSWGLESGSYGATSTGGDSWNVSGLNMGANRARFIPFVLNETVTVDGFGWCNGTTTVSGNIDMGLYDFFGNRLVSLGGQAQVGTSVVQSFAVAATILRSGNYFLALVQDNITGGLRGTAMNTAVQGILGCKEMAAAYPLPALAVFAAPTSNNYPWISAFTQTVF